MAYSRHGVIFFYMYTNDLNGTYRSWSHISIMRISYGDFNVFCQYVLFFTSIILFIRMIFHSLRRQMCSRARPFLSKYGFQLVRFLNSFTCLFGWFSLCFNSIQLTLNRQPINITIGQFKWKHVRNLWQNHHQDVIKLSWQLAEAYVAFTELQCTVDIFTV